MLRFNPQTDAWLLYARTPALVKQAEEIGMDRSIPASAREGCPVFYTHLEYAALLLWDVADADARDRLLLRRLEYEASCADQGQTGSVPCPSDREFMAFQLAGISYAMARPHALIGDDMGLGKTAQSIGVANSMGAERVLVVCPANVRLQWQREVRGWSTLKRVSTYPIIKSSDGTSPFANYTFVSYDLLRSDDIRRGLMAQRWDLLVLDEAHYLKTPDTKRTRAIFGGFRPGEEALADRVGKVLALTGTPLPNRPRECYTLARHLCWDAIDWMSEDSFQFRFNPSARFPNGHTEEKRGRLPELRARLRCNLMVRRLKRQVLKQLPEKHYELTYVEPNGAIRKALRAESLLKIDPEHLEEIDAETWGHIATVRREMGAAKVPRVVEHINMFLEGGSGKVVVFGHHREVLVYLADRLSGGHKIDGSTSPVRRQQLVDQFVADPSFRVLVGQLQSMGIGVDGLQKVCSWAVFAEASWTPGENEQALSRIDRHGQTSAVMAQFLVAPGSLDERVLGSALRKLRVTHDALDGGD